MNSTRWGITPNLLNAIDHKLLKMINIWTWRSNLNHNKFVNMSSKNVRLVNMEFIIWTNPQEWNLFYERTLKFKIKIENTPSVNYYEGTAFNVRFVFEHGSQDFLRWKQSTTEWSVLYFILTKKIRALIRFQPRDNK